nr:hypothetical protein [Tanacetum cinerariifolium]
DPSVLDLDEGRLEIGDGGNLTFIPSYDSMFFHPAWTERRKDGSLIEIRGRKGAKNMPKLTAIDHRDLATDLVYPGSHSWV